jgi:hypothetical protein
VVGARGIASQSASSTQREAIGTAGGSVSARCLSRQSSALALGAAEGREAFAGFAAGLAFDVSTIRASLSRPPSPRSMPFPSAEVTSRRSGPKRATTTAEVSTLPTAVARAARASSSLATTQRSHPLRLVLATTVHRPGAANAPWALPRWPCVDPLGVSL